MKRAEVTLSREGFREAYREARIKWRLGETGAHCLAVECVLERAPVWSPPPWIRLERFKKMRTK